MNAKRAAVIGLISASCLSVPAQLFTPESLGGAALGGLVGGIVGHNSGGRTAEGVGIGAGAGLLLGSLVHNTREEEGYYAPSVAYTSVAPYGYYDSYYSYRPNYAVTGAALGGLAGGIIGHNSHGRTLEGIGIGAGAGLLLGGLAEAQARRYEALPYAAMGRVYYTAPNYAANPAYTPTTAAPASPSASAPILNNDYGSSGSMSGANSLFGR